MDIIYIQSYWYPSLLLLLAGLFSFIINGRFKSGIGGGLKKKQTSPPGPRGLPLLGSLPMLGHSPHATLYRWAKQYGPIMSIKMGLVPTVVISDAKSAESVLKTHDQIFASRPVSEVGRILSNNFKGISFTPYGPYWRFTRKLCTSELLSTIKIESYRPTRMDEVGLMVRSIMDASRSEHVVDLTNMVSTLTRDITCRIMFGKKYSEDKVGGGGFNAMNEKLVKLAGAFNISDYVPWMRRLDIQGLGRGIEAARQAFDDFCDKIIEQHLEAQRDPTRPKDFVDHLLSLLDSHNTYEFPFDRANIKAIMMEMLLASISTTSATTNWVLSELFNNPEVMKKAQQELDTVVGKRRRVDESDLVKLEYLYMVIKETMRLHPAIPMLLPHEATQDCTLNGYHIPKGCQVVVNAWAIARDPQNWPSPHEFRPERFVSSNVDLKGQSFRLLPFGSGRRGCPGSHLGLTTASLVVAQLIHCFNWDLPNGMLPSELNMSEKPGIVIARAQHLLAIPSYRLMC